MTVVRERPFRLQMPDIYDRIIIGVYAQKRMKYNGSDGDPRQEINR